MEFQVDDGRMPRVPISSFKKNPAAYLAGGAVVTTRGRPRAVFAPISASGDLAGVKDQLRMLSRLTGAPGGALAALARRATPAGRESEG